MHYFPYQSLLRQQGESSQRYLEFLRVPSLSMGLYVLPVGAVDGQSPHSEDEVYYIVSGKGRFTCEGADRAVAPGDLLYVEAHADHRFHTIEETLQILVFFAPAEYSLKED